MRNKPPATDGASDISDEGILMLSDTIVRAEANGALAKIKDEHPQVYATFALSGFSAVKWSATTMIALVA